MPRLPSRHFRCACRRGGRRWPERLRAAMAGDLAEKRAGRSTAAGDRAATGRAQRAEERRQGAHGNAASGGAYHRGDEGGRGGLATLCSAPVLVLEPGDVGLGNHKATATGRRRTAVPTPLTANEQHHERAGGNACGPLSARLDLKAPVPWSHTDHYGRGPMVAQG